MKCLVCRISIGRNNLIRKLRLVSDPIEEHAVKFIV